MSLNPIIALAAVIKSCSDAKTRVKQNKRLCGHLVDVIEALDPVLETVKKNERGHKPTLMKLLEVVKDAEALLERQTRRRSFVLRMCTSTSAALEFDNINTRLAALTGTLTLSQSALSNAMLSSLSPRGDYKDPGEHPAHPSTTPSPTPPKPKGNTRTDGGIKPHEGDVKVLLSWRARSDVLAKLWPVDENPFSWKGVSFEEGRVTKLWLDDNHLSGSIPKELGQLSALTELWLDDNQLSGSIPKELGQLSALKDLRLHKNQLSGSIPEELGQLSALTLLWLNNNQLSGSIPKELGQLSALTLLWLNNNQLSGSIPEELGQLSALTLLWLDGNQLSGSIPKELGQLSALMRLDLHGNQLSGSIPEELGQLSALTELQLHRNQLSGSIPKELGKLSALKDLRIHNNHLSGSIPKELGQLSVIAHLDLSENQLSGSIPEELGKLSALTDLCLYGNQLSGSIPKELGQLSALKDLRIHNNQLSGSIPKELGQLSAIAHLDLSENQLSGSIPKELGQLSALALTDLCLYGNQLSGSMEVRQLSDITHLDPESPLVPPTSFSPASRASSHYASLSPAELQRLHKFREQLEYFAKVDPELLSTPDLRRFCSDSTLCRYLRARRWNVSRALPMLVSSLRWRRAERPESITWEDVAAEGTYGKQYVAGQDQKGRNVLVLRPGRENTNVRAGDIRFLIYTLERATWRDSPAEDPPLGSNVDHASEKLVILIDFTGWTLATAPPMKTSRETLSILQDHYPERLAVAVCYNPPWIFALFWKAISPFIDPETFRKIRFVNPKRAKDKHHMRQIFRMEVIDTDMGGEREPKFDAAAFARAARAHDVRKDVALAGSAKDTKTQAERRGERTRARDKSRGFWGLAFSV